MREIFPKRTIILNFHEGGVTARSIELPSLWLNGFRYYQRHDFSGGIGTESQEEKRVLRELTHIFKRLFVLLGFLSLIETSRDLGRVKPWIKSIRGPYSKISLYSKEVDYLIELMAIHDIPTTTSTIIHFRLGDLLSIKSKTYIDSRRILKALNHTGPKDVIDILSDSNAETVNSIFPVSSLKGEVRILNLSAVETIQKGCSSSYFIGTNSKISLWIAILRTRLGSGSMTWLPVELEGAFGSVTSNLHNHSGVRFY